MRLLMNYCNKWCVMLNHYDLGSLWFGLKSLVISWTTEVIWAQVWEFDRFGDCFRTCALIIWTVPWQLISEQDSTVNTSFVYLNKSFVKNLNSNLKSASGHNLYAQIRTIRWLTKVLTWGFLLVFCFVVHTACYCMDAIRLGGNVWIKIPLRPGKWELWEHDRPTVGLGESSCAYSHTYMSIMYLWGYLIVGKSVG
jgi:hypothetical protein